MEDRGGEAVRDRHGRGVRGSLTPGTAVASFDQSVRMAVQELLETWSTSLSGVEFAVAEVPPESTEVVLSQSLPGEESFPTRIVLFRRPIELRATTPDELDALVFDVIVEEVADFLGIDPADVDERYGESQE
jgi:hypothetical protein